MDDETQAELIAEQMRHANALLRAEIDALHAEQAHTREFFEHRLRTLEEQGKDHELRLRAATEGVTQFKLWSGLANGSAGLIALLAFVRSFLGG